MITQDEIQ